jgi:hypothetical protein
MLFSRKPYRDLSTWRCGNTKAETSEAFPVWKITLYLGPAYAVFVCRLDFYHWKRLAKLYRLPIEHGGLENQLSWCLVRAMRLRITHGHFKLNTVLTENS